MVAAKNRDEAEISAVLGEAWRAFTARGGSLFWAHLWAVLILMAGGAACGMPYFILFGPLWFGIAAMARSVDHGHTAIVGGLFSGFKQPEFTPSLVIGLVFLLLPAAAQTLMFLPLQGFLLSWAYAIEFDFRLLSYNQMVILTLLMLLFLFAAMLVQVVAIFLLAPAMFLYLDDPRAEAWTIIMRSARGVWVERKWWGKLWAWLGLIHLLGIFTCGLAWLIMHPWMALALSRAYDLRKGDFSPPPAPAVAPPPIPQSPPRFP